MHINTYYILLKRENTNFGFFRFVYSFVSSTSFDNRTHTDTVCQSNVTICTV